MLQLGLTAQDRCLCITAMFYTQEGIGFLHPRRVAARCVPRVTIPPRCPLSWDQVQPHLVFRRDRDEPIDSGALRAGMRTRFSRARIRVIRCTSSLVVPDFIRRMEERSFARPC